MQYSLMQYYSRWLHSYDFLFNIINPVSKEVDKVITAVLIGHFRK